MPNAFCLFACLTEKKIVKLNRFLYIKILPFVRGLQVLSKHINTC